MNMLSREMVRSNGRLVHFEKKEKDRSKIEKDIVKDFVLREGLMFKKTINGQEGRELYFVPKATRKSLVIRYHDLASHFSFEKTLPMMKECYYLVNMRRYVKMHIRNCFECKML